jgi:phospholipase C
MRGNKQYDILTQYCVRFRNKVMKQRAKITRRDFLKVLLATGGALLSARLLYVSRSNDLSSLIPSTTNLPRIYSDKIKNIIFFIQENHSFDSLFAGFPGANTSRAPKECSDALSKDPPHKHSDSLKVNGATADQSNCSYAETDAPNYWKVAHAFSLCDNYFSDIRGPSHPNYLMMTAGQSPIVDAPSPSDVCPEFCLDITVLPHRLDEQGLTWRDYGGIFTDIKSLVGRSEIMDYHAEQFFQDAAAGTLPTVSWLNSGFLVDGDAKSGHPPASLCGGENYAVSVLNAAMSGPQWSKTALFLVWDDWGGFYDHIKPPVVELWKDGTPMRYGHRVPCIVISPYARAGYMSHMLHSHVSLLHFAETVFDLKPLTERDAQASDMLDCFDFNQSALGPLSLTPRSCP